MVDLLCYLKYQNYSNFDFAGNFAAAVGKFLVLAGIAVFVSETVLVLAEIAAFEFEVDLGHVLAAAFVVEKVVVGVFAAHLLHFLDSLLQIVIFEVAVVVIADNFLVPAEIAVFPFLIALALALTSVFEFEISVALVEAVFADLIFVAVAAKFVFAVGTFAGFAEIAVALIQAIDDLIFAFPSLSW